MKLGVTFQGTWLLFDEQTKRKVSVKYWFICFKHWFICFIFLDFSFFFKTVYRTAFIYLYMINITPFLLWTKNPFLSPSWFFNIHFRASIWFPKLFDWAQLLLDISLYNYIHRLKQTTKFLTQNNYCLYLYLLLSSRKSSLVLKIYLFILLLNLCREYSQ